MSMTNKNSLGLVLCLLLFATLAGASQGQQEPQGASLSPFDRDRAFGDLETVVGFGPRPAGSAAIEQTRRYIVEELERAGLEPILDPFTARTPVGNVDMVNIRAIREGSRPETIALTGHYDTKVFEEPFVGANDGGSSTAVVLEMARISGELDLEHSLEFIFFDGEEAVVEWTATDSIYGSRYDVSRRVENGTLDELKALILVDMIGDQNLAVMREVASTEWLQVIIWETAADLGLEGHFDRGGFIIEDDHIPYLDAGIAAVDLIDFDYPYWHTLEDTLDKTNPDSLKVIGDVLFNALPAIDRRAGSDRR